MTESNRSHVAVIGGGLAGLAAAEGLARCGARVELFEARRHLGGRAGSFVDPASGATIDHCQHVGMGCCTNWLDFCRRTGVADLLRAESTLHFFGADGRRSRFAASGALPAPLHLAPALVRWKHLSWRDRVSAGRALLRLARAGDEADDRTVAAWLGEQRQSDAAVARFWAPVLISALSESLDRASLAAARKVFVDGFLVHRRAYQMILPTVPLAELYDRRVAEQLRCGGVAIHLGAAVASLTGSANGVETLQLADGTERRFDAFALAVPWRHVDRLMTPPLRAALPTLDGVAQIAAAPITSVHLWFDRPVIDVPHAVLLDRLSQWVFAKGRHPTPESDEPGHYYQVVISASHALLGEDRERIAGRVLSELGDLWPAVRAARTLHHRVVTQPHAVFSVRPGLDRLRPPQQTPIRNLALAGDWTATGWPATMEGAVRGGYLAAEALLCRQGRAESLVAPDLPPNWMYRLICGSR